MMRCECGLSNPNPRGWSSGDGVAFVDLDRVEVVSRLTVLEWWITDEDHLSLVRALLTYRSGR